MALCSSPIDPGNVLAYCPKFSDTTGVRILLTLWSFVFIFSSLLRAESYLDYRNARFLTTEQGSAVTLSPRETVFFRWVCPTSGFYQLKVNSSFGTPKTNVWHGDLTTDERLVDSSPDDFQSFLVKGGERYLIGIEGINEQITVNPTIAPDSDRAPNDHYTLPTNLNELLGQVYTRKRTLRATTEEIGPANSIWFQWQAPSPGVYQFFSNRPETLVVFDHQNLAKLSVGSQANAFLTLSSNQQLLIGISNETSTLTINKRTVNVNSSPRVATPLRLSKDDDSILQLPIDLSQLPPDNYLRRYNKSFPAAWYKITAPEDQVWKIGAYFQSAIRSDSQLFVFEGDQGVVGSLLGFSDSSTLNLKTIEGRSYFIAVGSERRDSSKLGENAASGKLEVTRLQPNSHSADDRSSPVIIPADGRPIAPVDNEVETPFYISVSNDDAERAATLLSGNSLWCRWTAPFSGTAAIPELSASVWDNNGSGRQIQTSVHPDYPSITTFPCRSGQTYEVKIFTTQPLFTGNPLIQVVKLDLDLPPGSDRLPTDLAGVITFEPTKYGLSLNKPFPPVIPTPSGLVGQEFTWTAPESGRYQFRFFSSWFNHSWNASFDILRKRDDDSYEPVSSANRGSIRILSAERGQKFRMRVLNDQSSHQARPERLTISWEKLGPVEGSQESPNDVPLNEWYRDTLAGAAEVSAGSLQPLAMRALEKASSDFFQSLPPEQARFYRFLAPQAGSYKIDVDIDTNAHFFLYKEDQTENLFPTFRETVDVWLPDSGPWILAVGAYPTHTGWDSLEFGFRISSISKPRGSFFANPIPLDANTSISPQKSEATAELGDFFTPSQYFSRRNSSFRREWYQWTAPSDGTYRFPFPTFVGNSVYNLKPTDANLKAGDTRYIRVSWNDFNLKSYAEGNFDNSIKKLDSVSELPVRVIPAMGESRYELESGNPAADVGPPLSTFSLALESEKIISFPPNFSSGFSILLQELDSEILDSTKLFTSRSQTISYHLPKGRYHLSIPVSNSGQPQTFEINITTPQAGSSYGAPYDLGTKLDDISLPLGTIGGDPNSRDNSPFYTPIRFVWKAPAAGTYGFQNFKIESATAGTFTNFEGPNLKPGAVAHLNEGEEVHLLGTMSGTRGEAVSSAEIFPIQTRNNSSWTQALELTTQTSPTNPNSQIATVVRQVSRLDKISPEASWYSWIAPSDGVYYLNYSEPFGMSTASFHKQPTTNSLEAIGTGFTGSRVMLRKGEVVYLAVSIINNDFNLPPNFPTRPAEVEFTKLTPDPFLVHTNRNFKTAAIVNLRPEGETIKAPLASLATQTEKIPLESRNSAWWRIVPEATGIYKIESSEGSVLVYSGTDVDSLKELQKATFDPKEVALPGYRLEKGQSYYVNVFDRNRTDYRWIGEIGSLSISPLPANLFSDIPKTLSLGVTEHLDFFSLPYDFLSFWFSYTPTTSGSYHLQVDVGTTEVFAGSTTDENKVVNFSNSQKIIYLDAGTTYSIKVSAHEPNLWSRPAVTLVDALTIASPVANDVPENAFDLGSGDLELQQVPYGPAFRQPNENAYPEGLISWATYTAIAPGNYSFTPEDGLSSLFTGFFLAKEGPNGPAIYTGLSKLKTTAYLEENERILIGLVTSDTSLSRGSLQMSIHREVNDGNDIEEPLEIGDPAHTTFYSNVAMADLSGDELEDNELEDSTWGSVWWVWVPKMGSNIVSVDHIGPQVGEQNLTVIAVSATSSSLRAGAINTEIHGRSLSVSIVSSGDTVFFIRYSTLRKYGKDFRVTMKPNPNRVGSSEHQLLNEAFLDNNPSILAPILNQGTYHSSTVANATSMVRIADLRENKNLAQLSTDLMSLPQVFAGLRFSPVLSNKGSSNRFRQLTPSSFAAEFNREHRADFERLIQPLSSPIDSGFRNFYASSEYGFPIAVDAVDQLGLYYYVAASLALADLAQSIETNLTMDEILRVQWDSTSFLSWLIQEQPSIRWKVDTQTDRRSIQVAFARQLEAAERVLQDYEDGKMDFDRTEHYVRSTPTEIRQLVERMKTFVNVESVQPPGLLTTVRSPLDFRPTELSPEGKVWAYSLPDPTWDGIFPGRTQSDWAELLAAAGQLANITSYQDWAVQQKAADASFDDDPDADPDSDGFSNWIEYAFASNPVAVETEMSPIEFTAGSNAFTYAQRIASQDVRYQLQAFRDGRWQDVAPDANSATATPRSETEKRSHTPPSDQNVGIYRLQAVPK